MESAQPQERGVRAPTREDVRGDTCTAGIPGHDARDEDAAAPEHETRVVASGIDPARLVQDRDVGASAHDAVELRAVAYVLEEPQQVAGIRGGETGSEQRAAPSGGE